MFPHNKALFQEDADKNIELGKKGDDTEDIISNEFNEGDST